MGYGPVLRVEHLEQFQIAALQFQKGEGLVVLFVQFTEHEPQPNSVRVEVDGPVQVGHLQGDMVEPVHQSSSSCT
jgi:hypothetical protein